MTTPAAGPDPALAAPSHEPVLLAETLAMLAPRPGGIYCDATIGLGGHARALLEQCAPDGRLIGLDRDRDALEAARVVLEPFGDRVTLVHTPFSKIHDVLAGLGVPEVDGIVADLGVSSPQLDRSERGFSFLRDGPLDMRMDQTAGPTARELIGQLDERALGEIIRDYGEERYARRIASAIVEARDRGALDSTGALAAIVAGAVPRRDRHKNPATRTFQALRIAVNRELGELEDLLAAAPGCLRSGGRLCVIAFHSLEDRLVKHRLRALAAADGPPPRLRLLAKRIVEASQEERDRNPRARSAKLRGAERVA